MKIGFSSLRFFSIASANLFRRLGPELDDLLVALLLGDQAALRNRPSISLTRSS